VSAREELCTNKEAVIRQGGATEVSSQTHAQRIKNSCGAEPPPNAGLHQARRLRLICACGISGSRSREARRRACVCAKPMRRGGREKQTE
jgi:hypothetical protein